MTAHVDSKNATLSIRIEPKLLKQLRIAAKKQDLPYAALVRLLIRNEIVRQLRRALSDEQIARIQTNQRGRS